ncbi:MAG TPA: hypothetical protein VI564_04030 [Candidatus Nanoarchaeia archaeon]|nr:hypothetical protein [Candidatus Nanoarchaeia archaeon]
MFKRTIGYYRDCPIERNGSLIHIKYTGIFERDSRALGYSVIRVVNHYISSSRYEIECEWSNYSRLNRNAYRKSLNDKRTIAIIVNSYISEHHAICDVLSKSDTGRITDFRQHLDDAIKSVKKENW